MASQGITLLGRVVEASDECITLAPDLSASLAAGDRAYIEFLDVVDAYVRSSGLEVPADPEARIKRPDPICVTDPIPRLDLREAGIASVIWATGYAFDFGWIDIPVFDSAGEPKHRDGITDIAGLYFIGLPWLSKLNSSFLSGVGDDAEQLARHIAGNR
jgi:putative flavoprotein involved in K+ transport